MDFNYLFHNTLVINLSRRYDRLLYVTDHLREVGIHADRFTAIYPKAISEELVLGWAQNLEIAALSDASRRAIIGCTLSHLAAQNRALRLRAADHVVILEDDVLFHKHLKEHLEPALAQVPADWQILFLGGLVHRKRTQVSEYVFRVSGVLHSHAYAIKYQAFQSIEEELRKFPRPIDRLWSSFMSPRYPAYAIMPFLAVQVASYSDVSQRFNSMVGLRKDSYLRLLSSLEYKDYVDRLRGMYDGISGATKLYAQMNESDRKKLFLAEWQQEPIISSPNRLRPVRGEKPHDLFE